MDTANLILLGILSAVFLNTCLNLFVVFPRVRRHAGSHPASASASDESSPPRISVLIPARNESGTIRACVESLVVQEYANFEILVLDDCSEDDTAEIVRGLMKTPGGERLRLLEGKPLPEGWKGKPWACHQLAEAADGDYFLFTDADTVHDPRCLASSISFAQKQRADLLSAWPRQVTGTWSEKLIIPLLFLFGVGVMLHILLGSAWLRRRLPEAIVRSLGAANGQFMCFRREVYEQVGGHGCEEIRNHMVEDVAFGRLFLDRGLRLVNADGQEIVRCRMYRNFGELWEGFSKNAAPVFDGKYLLFLLVGAFVFVVFVAPFLMLCVPGLYSSIVLAQVGILLAVRALLAWRLKSSWWGVILHPIAILLGLVIGLNSLRLSRKKALQWKGRLYDC